MDLIRPPCSKRTKQARGAPAAAVIACVLALLAAVGFPHGFAVPAAAQALDQREEDAFTAVQVAPTVDGLREFLRQFPLGRHKDEARAMLSRQQEIVTWESAKREDTAASYQSYLALYPEGRFAGEAAQRIAGRNRPTDFIIYRDARLDGAITAQPATSSPDECKRACAADQACQGYDFSYASRACNLYSSVSQGQAETGSTAGARSSVRIAEAPPPPPPPSPPEPVESQRSFIEVGGIDFPGQGADLNVFRNVSYPGCRQRCADNNRCRAYTYNKARSTCFTKSYVPQQVPYADAVSGYLPGAITSPYSSPLDFAELPGVDLRGSLNDIARYDGVTYARCIDMCRSYGGCSAYTYNVSKLACFLKDGYAYQKAFEGAISGMR